MCGEHLPYRQRTDVTVEFYHKTAIYNSRITGAKVPINIKSVESIVTGEGKHFIIITSDKGNTYRDDELTFPDKWAKNFALLIPSGKASTDPIPPVAYSAKPNLKLRHVWSEGYRATGEHATAFYHGCCVAESFIEACERLVTGLDRDNDGRLRMYKPGHPQVWGCSCFDNEADARKSFG
jgi:hypothetical protein